MSVLKFPAPRPRPDDPVVCPLCDTAIPVDWRGHLRFHRETAEAFLEFLRAQGKPPAFGDAARTRIALCTRLLAELDNPTGRRLTPPAFRSTPSIPPDHSGR